MICVFDVIDGPARGRRFWMRPYQRISVGRVSTADFAVTADAHMSRHHLILEANCEVVRLRDVGSVNGTFVNEARIQSLELRGGDRIRAGATIFELSILADHEDPHSKDGLSVVSPSQRTHQPQRDQGESIENERDQASEPSSQASIRYRQSPSYNPIQSEPLRHAHEATRWLDRQWWRAHFQLRSAPNFLEQRATAAKTVTLLDLMHQLPNSHPIGLIANCSQLSPAATETLYSSVDNRLITPLSQALLLLRCDGSPAVWRFVQQSLRLDAIICLVAEQDFQRSWLNDLLDQLSYPSMLANLFRAGNPLLQRPFQEHITLALFECTRSGELGLYLNPQQLLFNSDD